MTHLQPTFCAADRAAAPRISEATSEERRLSRSGTDHDGWFSKGELLTMRRNRRGGADG